MGTSKTLSTGGEGCPGCHARTHPRALNHPRSLFFGSFHPLSFLHPSTLPPAASRRLFSSKGKQDNFPHGTTATKSHSPTPLHSIPETFPFSILLLPGPWPPRLPARQPPFPATTQGHQPQTAGSRPRALPRATSGWWDGAGAEGPRRATVMCQRINTPLSSRLFTQSHCSGDGSSLSKRRAAAPLGKQPGVYLNVKQRSCSLDLQPLSQLAAELGICHAGAGWMGPWSPTLLGAPQAGSTRGESAAGGEGLGDSGLGDQRAARLRLHRRLPRHQHFCRFCFRSREGAAVGRAGPAGSTCCLLGEPGP